MAEEMNLYQKLAKIRKQVEVIRKNKKGFNYSYVSDDEILARVSVFLDKYGISLIPNVSMGTLKVEPYTYKKTKVSKQGEIYEETVNEVLVSADMTWTWVNNNKPEERINVDWVLVGQQADASQALGSALTYTNRYFLLKFFNIATPDNDPDNFRGKQREAEAAEDRAIADEIINTFDEELKEFLESHKGKTEDAKKLVAKYVKDGNYFKIKESAVAAKLLDDFEKTFLDKE
ncbi:ERF family protein [Oscillospiraceae bacterium 21-37]|uniref:ERF family protein n=1 Tax=Bacteroides acidifaciens TaxID=85831 RepID=UPI00248D377E|nr:ERF family protein [Bacteroides acidifaciens]